MSTRIAIRHRFEQRFDRRVSLSTHWLRLHPAPHAKGIEAYSLRIDAEPHFLNWARDPYENQIARLDLPEPIARLGFDAEVLVDLSPVNPFDFLVEPYASRFPFVYPDELRKELAPYLRLEPAGPMLATWLEGLAREPAYIAEHIGKTNAQVQQAFSVTREISLGMVDLEAVLRRGSGSPWELAWLLTVSLRSLGLASRFTSGYRAWLSTEPAVPDQAALHAWSEVYLPGAGWIGFDPAVGLFTAEGYIPLASAPIPLSTLPMAGYYEQCEADVAETLSLRRLQPKPRVWPYGEGTSADICALGRLIDDQSRAGDLRLTIGAGLSFVAVCNAHAPEWSVAALGPSKRLMAEELINRLWTQLAPGGFLHVGQGEWYAGEVLPRWRLHCFARADGRPVWLNPDLLCHRRQAFAMSADDAKNFADAVARRLGIADGFVMAAHEDGLHELWTRRVSFTYGPMAEDLQDPERRRILAARLSATRSDPKGYVLPLRWDSTENRWASGIWKFRRGGLYLTPGESALGYRLPLDSLPAGDESAPATDPERCQFDERPVLANVCGELSARFTQLSGPVAVTDLADGAWQSARPPRTALCFEVRDGQLHVFLPPLTHLEHYLELVAVIEATAEEFDIHVVLEGYEPPEDHRLLRLTVEPEAGILKLLLPGAQSFEQQLQWLQVAYREATQVGLRSERMTADGRRLPPGGRMDLVLGGETPADSPLLRRPDLLRSIISYWQRHPSLSYFLAGRSVGPGGPGPRPDEGRSDALYELGIALERMPEGEYPFPWMPDRLLRHLLTDPSGDIRRAEMRIDMLYPPDRSTLRLGRTTLRSFESPPDVQMASLQILLIMGLLGRFARMPCRAELVDWGSELHDRFMLPHVLWDDLRTVIGDLNDAGYPFRVEWFEPFLDLHFPLLGCLQVQDITVELRSAHEPWPLLAEEITATGKARFLDSANQRLEVRCRGLSPGRYALVCNGRRVPQRPTGVQGEYLAGVRFKASNPPSTLHPTKPPVAALVFDLIDTWTGRVLGGCTYLPPRPEIWGPAGAPVLPAWVGEGLRDEWHRLPPTATPTWSSTGQFLTQGSGVTHLSPPPEVMDPRYPYLLDLARLI